MRGGRFLPYQKKNIGVFWIMMKSLRKCGDFERVNYDFVKLHETMEGSGAEGEIIVTVHNPYQLNIRPEKQIAQVLGVSRSRMKSLVDQGKLSI